MFAAFFDWLFGLFAPDAHAAEPSRAALPAPAPAPAPAASASPWGRIYRANGRPRGILFFFHGKGQTIDDLLRVAPARRMLARARAAGFHVVLPASPLQDRSWKGPDAFAHAWHAIQHAVGELGPTLPRVYAGGSSGTGPALYYGLRDPQGNPVYLFIGGGGIGPTETLPAKLPRVNIVASKTDPIADPALVQQNIQTLRSLGADVRVKWVRGPHALPDAETAQATSTLLASRLRSGAGLASVA